MRQVMPADSSRTVVFTTMSEGTIDDSRKPRRENRVAPDYGDDGAMGAMTDFARAVQPTQATQLELAFSPAGDGGATVRARGELDIATADQAFAYLRDVLDSDALDSGAPDGPGGSLTINVEDLTFCDAAGLGALARLAGHAHRSGRELKLASARPSLQRIMRITGMDKTFPEVRTSALHMIAWPRQAAASE